jgi:hypothetical protein
MAARSPQPPAPHRCHFVGCGQVVPPEMLGCKRHWFMVPVGMRKRVLASYTAGQCSDRARIKPAWVQAANAAIEYVLQLELPRLIQRLKLPESYDPARTKVRRTGLATIVIVQPDMPPLVASLATGEVRQVKPPTENDPGDEHREKVQIGPLDV